VSSWRRRSFDSHMEVRFEILFFGTRGVADFFVTK
jgi:hypothetical protein